MLQKKPYGQLGTIQRLPSTTLGRTIEPPRGREFGCDNPICPTCYGDLRLAFPRQMGRNRFYEEYMNAKIEELKNPRPVYRVGVDGIWRPGLEEPRLPSMMIIDEYAGGLSKSKKNKKRSYKAMNVTKEIQKLSLSEDDRLLRKYDLQDENGKWTDDAVDVLDQILLDERKADLVTKLKEIDAKKTAEKKAK